MKNTPKGIPKLVPFGLASASNPSVTLVTPSASANNIAPVSKRRSRSVLGRTVISAVTTRYAVNNPAITLPAFPLKAAIPAPVSDIVSIA
jgi:hypothetical protein